MIACMPAAAGIAPSAASAASKKAALAPTNASQASQSNPCDRKKTIKLDSAAEHVINLASLNPVFRYSRKPLHKFLPCW